MEVFLPTKSHAISECDFCNDSVDHATINENVAENGLVGIAPGRDIDQLTFPRKVTPSSGLAKAMMNMNQHNVLGTNEEITNMPSQLEGLNNEIVHLFVENGSMEEDTTHNVQSHEENNIFQLAFLDIERKMSSMEQQVSRKELLLG